MSLQIAEGKDEGESKNALSDTEKEELITKVQEYFFQDESLSQKFEDFVNKSCYIINLNTEEYMLEYTEKYEEYKALFEHEMTAYIQQLGFTVHDFYEALGDKMTTEPNSSEAIFGMVMQSVTDFDIFMVMMREAAVTHQNSTYSRK